MNFRKMAEEMSKYSEGTDGSITKRNPTPTIMSKKERKERRAAYRASQKRKSAGGSSPQTMPKLIPTSISSNEDVHPNNTPISIDEETDLDFLHQPWTLDKDQASTDALTDQIRKHNSSDTDYDDFC